MNIKKLFSKRKSRFQVLEDKIKELEERIFNQKKSITDTSWWGMSWFSRYMGNYEPITLEEEISILQDKIDALCKKLKLELTETKEKDKEWVAKPLKEHD